ncbi:hypothetical protein ES705_26747 [subsurface metagenome]
MKIKFTFFTLLFLFAGSNLYSQDDLMDLLEEQVEEESQEVAYTFKSTRVINSHSIERMKARQLDFRINHRFGEVKQGWYDLWGLDNALISFDFGYGINDWLMVGFRRSTYKKMYDGSLKFSLFRQTTGSHQFPVAISYYTNMGIYSLKEEDENFKFTNRFSYTHQILAARKFTEAISLQIMPTYVHRNLVDYNEKNDVFAVGIGGRYKFLRRVAFTFEYFWANHTASSDKYYNPLSFGFDIETGGHVFQLFFTNSQIMEESGYITETMGSWADGGIYFGFNISRVFAIGGHKKE